MSGKHNSKLFFTVAGIILGLFLLSLVGAIVLFCYDRQVWGTIVGLPASSVILYCIYGGIRGM